MGRRPRRAPRSRSPPSPGVSVPSSPSCSETLDRGGGRRAGRLAIFDRSVQTMPLTHVPVAPLPPDRFRELLGDRYGELEEVIARAQEVFGGRAVWHVNSTARGGGVAELLQSLLAYARGGGVDARWVVIAGNPEFFGITKRIHNNLHGAGGDGGSLTDAERATYEETLASNAQELARTVAPADIVFLHDPQTGGLVEPIRETGATVVWRCHVGLDLPNDLARQAWSFLRPYVESADAYVFSREEFVW